MIGQDDHGVDAKRVAPKFSSKRTAQQVDAIRQQSPFRIDAMVVLPDHLHGVWTMPAGDCDFPKRWRRIKAGFSAAIPDTEPRSASRRRHGERGIWQRRYWEHLIRDERDLAAHVDYIHYNPVKHGYVQRVQDWPHSSFHRYVRDVLLPLDWGDAGGPDLSAGE